MVSLPMRGTKSPFDRFLGHQPDGPAGITFWRIAANHRDNALPLAFLQDGCRTRPLLVIECLFHAGIDTPPADLSHGLGSPTNNLRHFGGGLSLV